MKKLIILISILLIPISAFGSDWNYRGLYGKDNKGGVTEKLICIDNNCTLIVNNTNFFNVYKSYDSGLTWQFLYKSKTTMEDTEPTSGNISVISLPDTNYIFVTYYDRFIIQKSTNGGKSFEKIVVKDSIAAVNNLVMYDSLFGFATFGKNIFITKDSWKTWEIKYNDISPLFIYSFFNNSDEINYLSFANDNYTFSNYSFKTNRVTDYFYFYKNISEISEHKYSLQSLEVVNKKLMFGAGSIRNGVGDQSRDLIFKTTNGGYNWEIIHDYEMDLKFGLQDIACYDEKNCIAVGAGGKVIMTKDGGKSWVYHPEGRTPFKKGNESIYGPFVMHVAWAGKYPIIGTSGGNLYRYEGNFFDFGTSIEDTQPATSTIYPNPTSDKVSVDLGVVAVADLSIYDILGNEIMSIPNYTNKSEIDVSKLSIGTYTIQIQTPTGSVSQRLLVNR